MARGVPGPMMRDDRRKSVLFHRDFVQFSGGHLKVWHYFRHVAASASHEPAIYFTPRSRRDETNPWHGAGTPFPERAEWNPAAADILFAAGLDWEAIPEQSRTPVVNLIQGMRHAAPDDPRHAFLSRRAVRICVSEEVAEAVSATGRANGPVITIPNAIDDDVTAAAAAGRDIPLLLCGVKNPALADRLHDLIGRRGIGVVRQNEWMQRGEFLRLLGRAKVAVLLPCESEGCYLPALEAMALGTLVVCPDCIGNRSFCRDGDNSFRPDYTAPAIEGAVLRAVALSAADHDRMVGRGMQQARSRRLDEERRRFLAVLDEVPSLV